MIAHILFRKKAQKERPYIYNKSFLTLNNLTKKYGKDLIAVNSLNYSINKGKINALLGPNGAGKSTTIGMICKLIKPTDGSISMYNHHNNSSKYRSAIGYVAQYANLELDLTVMQNLKIHSMLYNICFRKYKERVDYILKLTKLENSKYRRVRELSGGTKRKVQIIRALIHNPEILILDEPTIGLDPVSRNSIWELIKSLNRYGKTILFSTHYMDEAEKHSDFVSIMDKGKIICEGSPNSLINDVGIWTLTYVVNGIKEINFFNSKDEAFKYQNPNAEMNSIKKTTLEDLFLSLSEMECATK